MKMNLSVVMELVDKVREPLNGMASSSDYYARKIDGIQAKQKDDSAAMSMLDAYQSLQSAMNKNTLAIDAEQEKLTALQGKVKEGEAPSAALTQQIAKQSEKLAKLTDSNAEYAVKLKASTKELGRMGVDLNDVDGEMDRLTVSHKKHQKAITASSASYAKLRKAIAPINNLNQKIKMPTLDQAKGMAIGGAGALGSLAVFGMTVTDTAEQVRILAQASEDTKFPVDALQALRLQASEAGAEAEDMDAALREMTLRWGEMKSLGSGAMNDYFKDTGNRQAYEDLRDAKNAQEAYLVLIREISAETDDAKRNFMMDEFFGGDSEKMMKVLGGGMDGYQAAMQKMQDTGGPVTEESIESATAFSSSLKTLQAIMNSLKVSALTPVMAELSKIMSELAQNMKNMDWREKAIAELKTGVMAAFGAVRAFASGVMFLIDNFKEIAATIALVKIGFMAFNAVVMMNPIGLVVSAIAAAAVAVTYLIDKFVGFDVIMSGVRDTIGYLKEKFIDFMSMIPSALLPDSWAESIAEMKAEMDSVKDSSAELGFTINEETNQSLNVESQGQESLNQVRRDMAQMKDTSVSMGIHRSDITEDITHQSLTVESRGQSELDRVRQEMAAIQDKNVQLGITTDETVNQQVNQQAGFSGQWMPDTSEGFAPVTNTQSGYQPLGTQTVKSQSEVQLTIKSDKPVQVDNINSDKQTDVNLNLGNMAMSY